MIDKDLKAFIQDKGDCVMDKCKKCNMVVMKASGCNHMTCP